MVNTKCSTTAMLIGSGIVIALLYIVIQVLGASEQYKDLPQYDLPNNEVIGFVFEPKAGPLNRSVPIKDSYYVLYRDSPFLVAHNKSLPMCQ